MRLHLSALVRSQWARLEEDPVRDGDLADIVEEEPPLQTGVVEQRRRYLESERGRVGGNPARVLTGAEITRFQRCGERAYRLRVGVFEQLVLAVPDLDQPVQIRGVGHVLRLRRCEASPFDLARDHGE